MGKTIKTFLLIILILSLSACGGNVKNVNIVDVDSDIYSETEINDAIDMVLKFFKENFGGCSLKEIQYVGDDYHEEFEEWQINTRRNKQLYLYHYLMWILQVEMGALILIAPMIIGNGF
jgi:hypothetical protein